MARIPTIGSSNPRSPRVEDPRRPGIGWILAIAILTLSLGVACAHPVPPAENVVDDDQVRGCSLEPSAPLVPTDVAIVIDTSQSTARPTGADIDGDGIVRSFQRNPTLDRGDSRLAAQIAALRPLVRQWAGRGVRFSVVTYSGPSVQHTGGRTRLAGSRRDSEERVPLTSDGARLDAALRRLLDEGSEGKTIFYAGMRRATLSLLADAHSDSRSRRRVVLLLSDTATPNGLAVDGRFMNVDWRMMNAAVKAREHSIVIHTFGLSPEAAGWRHRPIGQIAGATGGDYHPVEDPQSLTCHLARAIQPADGWVRRQRAFVQKSVGSPAQVETGDTSEEIAARP